MASEIRGRQRANRLNARTAACAEMIRDRRRRLDLTLEQVALRLRTSPSYLALIESGKRRPSNNLLRPLAELLGLDQRQLFIHANPDVAGLITAQTGTSSSSAWDEFRNDQRLQRLYRIASDEMDLLAGIQTLGEVRSPQDFIYVLNTIRFALGRRTWPRTARVWDEAIQQPAGP